MIQSAEFWFGLAGSAAVFWLLKERLRLPFLAIVSLLYIARLEPLSALSVFAWSALFFLVAPLARTSRPMASRVVPFLVIGVLAYLAYFKYFPNIATAMGFREETRALVIPLGISYFTFKLIHYAIEVGRGNIVNRSPSTFAAYMFLFPIYTAGPIERYDHFLSNRSPVWRSEDFATGVTRISHGLIKKMVFSPLLLSTFLGTATGVEQVLTDMPSLSTAAIWRWLGISYLAAYLDFSAYSDLAIGASRLFGITIQENFRWPILATNIGEFWKRWHMTLAGWCQAYAYMPALGLTRNPYIAVYATFVTMGLWHAGNLNWVMWGLYHATGVAVYLTWLRVRRRRKWMQQPGLVHRAVGMALTFGFVTASLAFTATHGRAGLWSSLRIFAKLFGIDLQ